MQWDREKDPCCALRMLCIPTESTPSRSVDSEITSLSMHSNVNVGEPRRSMLLFQSLHTSGTELYKHPAGWTW